MFTVTAKFTDGSERSKAFVSKHEAEVFSEKVWASSVVTYVAVKDGERIICEFER